MPHHTLSSELLHLLVSCVGANCVLLQIQEMRSTVLVVLVKNRVSAIWITVPGLQCWDYCVKK